MAFDQAKACELIAEGKSLREVGKLLGCNASTICKTAVFDPEFGQRYARAMEARSELDVVGLDDIRADMLAGKITPEQARVAADLIKWPAARRRPKVFGDRLAHDVDAKLEVTVRDLAREK